MVTRVVLVAPTRASSSEPSRFSTSKEAGSSVLSLFRPGDDDSSNSRSSVETATSTGRRTTTVTRSVVAPSLFFFFFQFAGPSRQPQIRIVRGQETIAFGIGVSAIRPEGSELQGGYRRRR
jgi:hypothetical protein